MQTSYQKVSPKIINTINVCIAFSNQPRPQALNYPTKEKFDSI